MKATGTTLGVDDRAPIEEAGREEKEIAVDSGRLILRQIIESLPHRNQRGVRPRVRCHTTTVQRRRQGGKLAIRTTSNTTSTPGARSRLLPVTDVTSMRNSRLR